MRHQIRWSNFLIQFLDPIFPSTPLLRNALKNWIGKLDRKLETSFRKVNPEIGTSNFLIQFLDPISWPASQRGWHTSSQRDTRPARPLDQPAIQPASQPASQCWYCSAPRSNSCVFFVESHRNYHTPFGRTPWLQCYHRALGLSAGPAHTHPVWLL